MLFCHIDCIFLQLGTAAFLDRHRNLHICIVAGFPKRLFALRLLLSEKFLLTKTPSPLKFLTDNTEQNKSDKNDSNRSQNHHGRFPRLKFLKIRLIECTMFLVAVNGNASYKHAVTTVFFKTNGIFNKRLILCKIFIRHRDKFTLKRTSFFVNYVPMSLRVKKETPPSVNVQGNSNASCLRSNFFRCMGRIDYVILRNACFRRFSDDIRHIGINRRSLSFRTSRSFRIIACSLPLLCNRLL